MWSCCVSFNFFSTMPRDRLGRMFPKCPIFCGVGRKTLTQSITQPTPTFLGHWMVLSVLLCLWETMCSFTELQELTLAMKSYHLLHPLLDLRTNYWGEVCWISDLPNISSDSGGLCNTFKCPQLFAAFWVTINGIFFCWQELIMVNWCLWRSSTLAMCRWHTSLKFRNLKDAVSLAAK